MPFDVGQSSSSTEVVGSAHSGSELVIIMQVVSRYAGTEYLKTTRPPASRPTLVSFLSGLWGRDAFRARGADGGIQSRRISLKKTHIETHSCKKRHYCMRNYY